ncbi:calcium-binding protein [Pseudoprimorskyibacter insulae]|uniref:Leukotoxin n=1 Tax=Pseudoprimorskyibacter insulae TaxID=1695997 RepID=A0A2R8AQQ7_9RHOB|nr:calcium-binding protein [Pseudoprimorskyibacter insulae]SPF78207.1 Leukotoxin [Pseudoprimorskyibacter insulae]
MAQITGTTGNDDGGALAALIGTDDGDSISGLLGDDRIEGGGGNDTLSGDLGIDTVLGGDGDDWILHRYQATGDSLDGGSGNDTLFLYVDTAQSGDTIDLTAGSYTGFEHFELDTSTATELMLLVTTEFLSQFTSFGRMDQLVIVDGGTLDFTGVSFAEGTTGKISTLWHNLLITHDDYFDFSGTGIDWIVAPGFGSDTVIGGSGNDILSGSGDKTLIGNDGDDTITVVVNGSFIDAGAGNDEVLVIGSGSETTSVFLGAGDDLFRGVYVGREIPALVVDGGEGRDVFSVTGELENWTITEFEVLQSDYVKLTTAQFAQFDEFNGARVLAQADAGTVDLTGKVQNVTATKIDYSASDGADVLLWNDATVGLNVLMGGGNDSAYTGRGNDTVAGGDGDDTLEAGDGADTLNGDTGNDVLIGGSSADDLRDVFYAGDGNDFGDGGYGNDLFYGGAGNDTFVGGFGADEILGQDGDDQLTGQALSDLIFGGTGDDFINGGFGFDRLNGGTGADKFFHQGAAGHGSDWIQDYNAAEGDVLFYGGAATKDDFLVQTASTTGAGSAEVDEVFITHINTGVLLWALVDGADQASLLVKAGNSEIDLLA